LWVFRKVRYDTDEVKKVADKIGLISLGCPKNRVDSEIMLGLLEQAGFELTAAPDNADVLIVNTCGFIDAAKQESIDTILEMNQYRERGRLKALVVAGCLSQRYQQHLWDQLPEIDAMVGTGEFHRIVEAVQGALHGERPAFWGQTPIGRLTGPRRLTTLTHTAYLKIAEGCNHQCAFCAIPIMRGRYQSRGLEDIVAEARQLAAQGVKEIILVAQDSTVWGFDLYGRPALPKLLRALADIDDLLWIRIMYSYPTQISRELIDTIRSVPKVARYLDMPLQHAHPEVLQRMGRPFRREYAERVIHRLRDAMPDITLRTTFIVGFPGETEEHFETLLAFMQSIQFDHVGIFAYSPEEGTRAQPLGDPIPDAVKARRRRHAMLLQRKLVGPIRRRHVGQVFPTIIEHTGERVSIGRGPTDAPEIDGVTYVRGQHQVGHIVPVRITGIQAYDFIGEPMTPCATATNSRVPLVSEL
jgi:ribosomal protein S12 methylthiotransferase